MSGLEIKTIYNAIPENEEMKSYIDLKDIKIEKKNKVGLSTLFSFLMRQGFARCRVIWPCDIFRLFL